MIVYILATGGFIAATTVCVNGIIYLLGVSRIIASHSLCSISDANVHFIILLTFRLNKSLILKGHTIYYCLH